LLDHKRNDQRGFSATAYRALLFLATVGGLTQILFLVDANFSRAKQFHESDYIMTFYVAGHLVAAGKESDLYPPPDATSFIGASFDKAAHSLLDGLPEKTTAIYMYSPLVAWFFAPLSHAGPNGSLFLWHAISLIALALSCKLLADSTGTQFRDGLFFCSLFGPVFITLWSGQLGFVFGLLPLSVGLLLLLKDRAILAGVVWSLLLLKPQYFPAVAFVALALFLRGNFRLALGLALGTSVFVAANLLLFSSVLISNWLASHRLSDTLFTHAQYGIPVHLITSLPADILLMFPASSRSALKWPIYFGALLLWLIGLWCSWKINAGTWDSRTKISLTLSIGCVLSSLALPHLLYYDLCILIPAGFILASTNNVVPRTIATKTLARLAWITVSLYLPIFLLFTNNVARVFTVEMILLVVFVFLLVRITRAIELPNAV
jgi:glycosyl transferase family 87